MTAKIAIWQANLLRPNKIDDSLKLLWLDELEAEIAELMDVDTPEPCEEDTELLMPAPHDQIYPYHVMTRIDVALEEMDRYQADAVDANDRLHKAKAWWRRNHRPDRRTRFEVMN